MPSSIAYPWRNEMTIANKDIMFGQSERLPYDAEVEYIESTGTQYIDTGVPGTDTTNIWLDVYRPSDAVVFGFGAQGIGWGKNTLCIITGNGFAYWMYGASVSSTYISTSSTLVGRITFESNANVLTTRIGADTKSTTSNGTVPFTTPVNLYLFTRPAGTGGTVDYTNGISGSGTRIYGATISDNELILRSFTPVRFTNELGQSEGAMCDRVSGQLFRNAGSGAFLIGPDKTGGGNHKCVRRSHRRFLRPSARFCCRHASHRLLWRDAA